MTHKSKRAPLRTSVVIRPRVRFSERNCRAAPAAVARPLPSPAATAYTALPTNDAVRLSLPARGGDGSARCVCGSRGPAASRRNARAAVKRPRMVNKPGSLVPARARIRLR
ncbi:hypothetical protein MTO96_025931 [Rhipicephalus appendiculatus]